jgi:hypothetical protein
MYNTQGTLVCAKNNTQKIKNYVEPFVAAMTQGRDGSLFTEIATSQTIWDHKSASMICTPLCLKNEQEWNGGFRSVGGSVCYCVNGSVNQN